MSHQENQQQKPSITREQALRAVAMDKWDIERLYKLERLRAAAYSSLTISVILKTDLATVKRLLSRSGLTKLYPMYVQGIAFSPISLTARWPGGIFKSACTEIPLDLVEEARHHTPEAVTFTFSHTAKELTPEERKAERDALSKALQSQKEISIAKIRTPMSKEGGLVTAEGIALFIRSDGDIVKKTEDGWLLNSRPVTVQDLLSIANRRRRLAGKEPFELKE